MRYTETPAKVLAANVSSALATDKWPYDDGMGDPFWSGGSSPTYFRWTLTVSVTEQSHSSYKTRKPFAYNGMDVSPGDYIADTQFGIALKIISVLSKTDTDVTVIVEDVFRYNTFRAQGAVGFGLFNVPSNAVIFELNQEGLPIVDPIPPSYVATDFFTNLMSRFQNLEQNSNFILHKPNHGFSLDELISVDPTSHTFVPTDSTHPYIIGTVSGVNYGPDYFAINPIQKVLDNIDGLIGNVGDILYADDDNPGQLTLTAGSKPVLIKLLTESPTVVTGTVTLPQTSQSPSTFTINQQRVTVGGTGSVYDIVTAFNTVSNVTGVTASLVRSPTVLQTSLTLGYGEPALTTGATATINGVLVNFTTTTVGFAAYGDYYSLEQDMAADINAANIPNIVASTPSDNVLRITHLTGGAITITNGSPDTNGYYFAGDGSGSGLALSAAASSNYVIKLAAVDARAINLYDVQGQTMLDCGLVSAENGQKAAALYIERGLRTTSITVVANKSTRDALTASLGDMTYVIDDGQGANLWALYLYDGSTWQSISTSYSAASVADSYTVTLTPSSSSSTIGPLLKEGTVISSVTVNVITPFDGDANTKLEIGLSENHSLLMSNNELDLSVAGEYTSTPMQILGSTSSKQVRYYFTPSNSTVGQVKVTVTTQ
jgi:hypothetical protein